MTAYEGKVELCYICIWFYTFDMYKNDAGIYSTPSFFLSI